MSDERTYDKQYGIPKLGNDNYYAWSRRAKSELIERNCWNAIDPGWAAAMELNADQERLNRKAVALLLKIVSDALLEDVGDLDRAKDIWDKLRRIHSTYTLPQCLEIKRDMMNVTKGDDMTMFEYMAKIQALNRKVASGGFGLELNDRQLGGQFLIGLPKERYGVVVNFIGRQADLTTESVKSALLREDREGQPTESSTALASNAGGRGKGGGRGRGGRGGGRGGRGNNNNNANSSAAGQGPRNNEGNKKCFNCDEWGHISKECNRVKCYRCGKLDHYSSACTEVNPNDNGQKSSNNNNQDNNQGNGGKKVRGCVTVSATVLASQSKNEGKWIVDCAATDYICHSKAIFKDLKKCTGEVCMGEGKAQVEGYGTVDIDLTDECGGYRLSLTNVLYVPSFDFNLISAVQMARKGIFIELRDDSAVGRDKDSSEVIFKAFVEDNLYKVSVIVKQTTSAASCLINENAECSDVIDAVALRSVAHWHEKLGHLHDEAIKKIPVIEATGSVKDKCDVCVKGKITKVGFPKLSERIATKPLQLIHSDVMGKLPVSIGGSKYLVTFIDDFSRFVFVYPLKKKNDVFETFKRFKTEVETYHECKIKAFQTDGGGEYVSLQFKKYLEQNGIKHRVTVADCAAQNGVSERQNRTLGSMARCMLIQSNAPVSFWAEAINTACYIRNISPSRAISNKIPWELWYGTNVKLELYENLRVFGCKGWYRVDKGGKFSVRAVECVYLGPDWKAKGHRVWVPSLRGVKIVHHAVFDEKVLPFKYKSKTVSVGNTYVILEPDVNDVEEGAVDVYPDIFVGELFGENLVNDDDDEEEAASGFVHENDMESIHSLDSDDGDLGDVRVELELEVTEEPVLRRSQRGHKPKVCSCCNIAISDANVDCHIMEIEKPLTAAEALKSDESVEWQRAMLEEVQHLKSKGVFILVPRPVKQRVLGSMWVLKMKMNADNSVSRYRARLVALGCAQRPGEDYHDIHSPVAKKKSIRTLLALAVENEWSQEHIDVLTAYLNSPLRENLFMEQPEFFEENGNNMVCKLNKTIYGLKQSGREWYKFLDNVLFKLGMRGTISDPCVYVGNGLVVAIYVDDICVWGKPQGIDWFKRELSNVLEVRLLGDISCILSLNVNHLPDGSVTVDQCNYVRTVLANFNMLECKARNNPLEVNPPDINGSGEAPFDSYIYSKAVGNLLYLSGSTRPDICYAVCDVSQRCNNPTESDWQRVKQIFRYLKGTCDLKLRYSKKGETVQMFCDADWANSKLDRKSIIGYVVILAGCPIIWQTRKQRCVALSTVEAEYLAMTEAAKEATWLNSFLSEINQSAFVKSPYEIFADNQGAIFACKNRVVSEKMKHMDVKVHYLRDLVEQGRVEFKYVETDNNLADVFTKVLNGPKTKSMIDRLGLTC